jgi:hypothetical protein
MAATDFGLNEHPRSFRTPRAAISAVTARRLNFPPLGFFASKRLRQRYDFGSLLSVALAPLDPFAGRLRLRLRAAASLATRVVFSNSAAAPSTWRTSTAVGVSSTKPYRDE